MSVILDIVLILSLAFILISDIKHQIIPNSVLIFLFVCRIIGFIMLQSFEAEYAVNFLITVITGIAVYFMTKGKIGAGDVKLEAVISLYLTGEEFVFSLLVSVVAMLFWRLGKLLFHKQICAHSARNFLYDKKATFSAQVPLAPFIVVGVIVALAVK